MIDPNARSRQSQILLALVAATATLAVLLSCCIGILLLRSANRPPAEAVATRPPPFDLESLCGLTIDGVRNALGRPADNEPEPTALQIKFGIDEWSNEFEKDGQQVLVTFKVQSRQIIDFFVSGDEMRKVAREWRLDRNSSKYRLEAVKALGEPGITGVKVIPMPSASSHGN